MQIASLADHLDLIDTIAHWHWEQWGHTDPADSLASRMAHLRRCTNRDRIPAAFVALDETELCGTALLVTDDMTTHPELSPWLASVFVAPAHRGKGIASALVRHAVQQAAAMGVARLYLFTETARELYEKLGWRAIAEDHYEGQPVTIMAIDLSA
ncbi:MAG: GNAT family N-acetyltransferase [Thermomicrobiales bacterium]